MFTRHLVKIPFFVYFVIAQIVVVVASLVKVKMIAVYFGAQGIALYGIITNVYQIGSHISLMGMHSSGVRSIAQVRDDPSALIRTVSVYLTATTVMTAVGAIAVPAAAWMLGMLEIPGYNQIIISVGLSMAIVLTAIATMQGTVFKGVGAVRMVIARNIVMPIAGVLFGVISVYIFNIYGILAFFIFQPLAGIILSALWWQRATAIPPQLSLTWLPESFYQVLRPMIIGGSVFLISSLIFETSILAGRTILQKAGEIDQLAFLNASWVLVTMSYGFMHGIMSTWLYPILASATRGKNERISKVVEAIIIITSAGGSVFVILIVPFSDTILRTVYSSEFTQAAPEFNMAMVGLLAQLLAAPILYLLLSRGNDRIYLFYHVVVGAAFVIPVIFLSNTSAWMILSYFSITNWIGIAFLVGGLHLTHAAKFKFRTYFLVFIFTASALMTVLFGQEPFVKSILFLPVVAIFLLVAALATRRDIRMIRNFQIK